MLCCEMVGRSTLMGMIEVFSEHDVRIDALRIVKRAGNGVGLKLGMVLPRSDRDDDSRIGVSGRSGSNVPPLVALEVYCKIVNILVQKSYITISSNSIRSGFYLGVDISQSASDVGNYGRQLCWK